MEIVKKIKLDSETQTTKKGKILYCKLLLKRQEKSLLYANNRKENH